MPALVGDVEAELPRVRTERHAELILDLAGAHDWTSIALRACLRHLSTSSVTDAARVLMVDAWVEDDDGFCIIYRPPYDEGRVVGLRRCRQDAIEPGDWRLGDMTTWGYDMGRDVDPVAFGWNVADFDVGEPLGYVTTILRYDRADIGWWGNLGDDLPRRPAPID